VVVTLAGAGATAVVTGAVDAVVEERVLMLPGASSVEPAVSAAEGGSEAWRAEVSADAGTVGAGAAASGAEVGGAEGCSCAAVAETIGVSENRVTAGRGEKIG